MKTKYIFLSVWAIMMAFTMTSCEGFLNQPPYDDLTDEEYWQNEDQARTYMYGFYTSIFSGYGTGTSHGPFLMGQTLNDDFASDVEQQDLTPLVVPESDGSWSFSSIRKAIATSFSVMAMCLGMIEYLNSVTRKRIWTIFIRIATHARM